MNKEGLPFQKLEVSIARDIRRVNLEESGPVRSVGGYVLPEKNSLKERISGIPQNLLDLTLRRPTLADRLHEAWMGNIIFRNLGDNLRYEYFIAVPDSAPGQRFDMIVFDQPPHCINSINIADRVIFDTSMSMRDWTPKRPFRKSLRSV